MSINLTALKSEITTDPVPLGYAGKTDEQIAALLAVANRPGVNRETMDGGLLASALVRSEYANLVANDKDYVRLLCATATPIPLTNNFKTELGAVFPNPSTTRTRLVALLNRTGTRAEELNLGGQPTASDVADAKRLP